MNKFEKELNLNFGFIEEQLNKIFDLIDKFNIIDATSSLVELKFSNLKETDVSNNIREWIKDVNRYFKLYEREPLVKDGVMSVLHKYNEVLNECNEVGKILHPTKEQENALNGNIKLLLQLEKTINDFSERLKDYFIVQINTYLEDIHDTMLVHQNNENVYVNLVRIENALQRKQERIVELQNTIDKSGKWVSVEKSE